MVTHHVYVNWFSKSAVKKARLKKLAQKYLRPGNDESGRKRSVWCVATTPHLNLVCVRFKCCSWIEMCHEHCVCVCVCGWGGGGGGTAVCVESSIISWQWCINWFMPVLRCVLICWPVGYFLFIVLDGFSSAPVRNDCDYVGCQITSASDALTGWIKVTSFLKWPTGLEALSAGTIWKHQSRSKSLMSQMTSIVYSSIC